MRFRLVGALAVLVFSILALAPAQDAQAACFGFRNFNCGSSSSGGLGRFFRFLRPPAAAVPSGGDIDIRFDDLAADEPDERIDEGEYTVNNRYIIFNDGILAVNSVTASGHVSISTPGNITSLLATPSGGTAPVSCTVSNQGASSFDWSCTFSLAIDDGTANDNIADGSDVDQVDITVTVSGASPPTDGLAVITYGAVTVTAAGATSDTVSPSNTDGGSLVFAENTDVLLASYDVDIEPLVDVVAGEDLDSAGGYTSLIRYSVFNDRSGLPMGPVTISGRVSASAAIINQPIVIPTNSGVGSPTTTICSTSNISTTGFDWSCTFNLGPDTPAGSGSNTPSCSAPCTNVVQITVGASSVTAGAAGNVITYSEAPVSIDGAVNNTVSPKNADGGTIIYAVNTDVLS